MEAAGIKRTTFVLGQGDDRKLFSGNDLAALHCARKTFVIGNFITLSEKCERMFEQISSDESRCIRLQLGNASWLRARIPSRRYRLTIVNFADEPALHFA